MIWKSYRPVHCGGVSYAKNDLVTCCYNCYRRVKRREGKPQRFARAIRATDKSPFGRLGKHGTCRMSQDGLTTLKVGGEPPARPPNYRGVSIC